MSVKDTVAVPTVAMSVDVGARTEFTILGAGDRANACDSHDVPLTGARWPVRRLRGDLDRGRMMPRRPQSRPTRPRPVHAEARYGGPPRTRATTARRLTIGPSGGIAGESGPARGPS